jgi:two-component system nitrate/nitrite sensor histidine kinase NarX
MMVHDLPNDARFLRQRVKSAGFHTCYALPLRHSGDTVGVLTVFARDPAALTNEAELRLLGVMADQIASAVENARLHAEVETLAIHTERERLAREMHDGLAQVLGYVNTKAQAVKELLKSGQADVAVQHMEQLEVAAQETYDDVREAILALGTNGRNRPLLDLLREYVARFSEMSDIPAELVVEGEPTTFKPGVEVQLLRIVQESLANVRKHAQAGHVQVKFTFGPTGCRLAIEDDGRGFEPGSTARGPWPHLGLQSMEERAGAISARFKLDTSPGEGTRIAVELSRAVA